MTLYFILLFYSVFIMGRCVWALGLNDYLCKKSIWDLRNDFDNYGWYSKYFDVVTWIFNVNTYVYWKYSTIYNLLKRYNKK